MASAVLANWLVWASGFAVFLVATLVAILAAVVSVAAVNWHKIRRLGAPLTFARYMSLRWHGANPAAIAAAYWSAGTLGGPVALEEWNTFAVLNVDVLRLAGALAAAEKANIATKLAPLGAAALAGYDPVEVVKEARRRGLAAFTTDDLQQLAAWGLKRFDETPGDVQQ